MGKRNPMGLFFALLIVDIAFIYGMQVIVGILGVYIGMPYVIKAFIQPYRSNFFDINAVYGKILMNCNEFNGAYNIILGKNKQNQ